jgi:hypothetical protein
VSKVNLAGIRRTARASGQNVSGRGQAVDADTKYCAADTEKGWSGTGGRIWIWAVLVDRCISCHAILKAEQIQY